MILTVLLLLAACKNESTKLSLDQIKSLPKHTFTYKNKFEVAGRQGIATDGEYYYVSGSKEIYKYDKEGNLIESNTNPF